MKKLLHWPSFLGFAGISGAVGAALHYFGSMSFWYGVAIGAGALLINGIIATVEDEIPGGLNNPRQKRSDIEKE